MAAERVRGGRRAPRIPRWSLATAGTTPRRRARVAGPRALGLGLITALLALGTATGGLAPALATTTTEPTDELRISLLAAPGSSGIARPGEPLSVRVTVTNLGTAPTPQLDLALDLDGSRAVAATELEQWLTGASIDTDARTAASATLSPLDPGSSAVLDLIVAAERAAATGAFGARLAAVRANAGDELIAVDRTAIVWVPAGSSAPSADTVFVAPLSTPGIGAGLLDAVTLARLTDDAGDLTRQLGAVAGRPVLVGIDPRVIASIRLLGDSAPASATAFLDRLSAIPNETFLLPWADADTVAVLAAGGAVPEPEGSGARTTTAGAATDDPDPQPVATDLATAAAWPVTFDGTVWTEGGLTDDVVVGLADAGARTIIAPSTAFAGREVAQRLDGLRIVQADAALSAAARAASTASSQQRFDRAIAQVSALLAARAGTAPRTIAVIALGRDELPSSDRLVDTIARTVSLPWSTASAVSAALDRASVEAELVDAALADGRTAAVAAALRAETADRGFAVIATDPAMITDRRRLELLAALSHGWGDESSAALQRFVDASVALRSSVRVAESSAITLLADRASLPVTVQNDLDVAVRVFVRVEPDTAQLRVLDERVEVVVEPRSQTRALVPVESLTNGQVTITVTVRDTIGGRIGDPTRVALNLQAGWETAGTIAVGAGVVLLLVVGISRDIRKRRRQSGAGA